MIKKICFLTGIAAALFSVSALFFVRYPFTPKALCCAAESYSAAEIVSGDKKEKFGSLKEALSAWENGSTLRLLTNSQTTPIPVSGEKTLDLNGFCLSCNGGGSVLSLLPSSKLSVIGAGKICGGNAECGGGIYAENAQLYLHGVTVSGNSAIRGGGVYLNNSRLWMSGGAFCENSADYGGGVYLFESFAELLGSSVSSNSAAVNGGGVYLWGEKNSAELVLKEGALLENNNAQEFGGGVAVWSRGSAAVVGNCTIRENYAGRGGGGLFLHGLWEERRSAKATVAENAEICGNRSDGCGGGVNVVFGGLLEVSGGSISHNTASVGAGIAVSISGFARFGGNCKAVENTLFDGTSCSVFSERTGQIEIASDFTGQLRFSMPYEGSIGKIYATSAAGLRAESEKMELILDHGELIYKSKPAVPDDRDESLQPTPEGSGNQENQGQDGNVPTLEINASTREGERAIAIMIGISAAAALIFLGAGFFSRIFKKHNRSS